MPSIAHQHLLLWIARRMTRDGFVLTGFDGPAPYAGRWNQLPPPFSIAGVRCDATAVSPETDEIAVGEAKTAEDLATDHTHHQLRILGGLVDKRSGALCPLYIAVPRSVVYELDRALIATGLIGARHVIRLHIPDVLLQESVHVARPTPDRIAATPSRWH